MSGLFEDDTDALPTPPAEGPGLFGDAPPAKPGALPQPADDAPRSAVAYRVLARKYRPTRFEDLIGQDAMVRTLRNAFALNRVAHAFMLTGVRGVGKTTTARIIARALNCVGPDGTGGPTPEPCGVCPECVAILADRHPDVAEMDAASRTGVDDVREIIEATRFRPLQARTKVFVIDEVHMLSRNAFNALLKTLEEPPPHVKFIFATTELRKVPVTVLSRCQRFELRRISSAELAAHFGRICEKEGVAAEPEALSLIARAADGSARDGLSLLDQAIAQHTGDGPVAAGAVAEMLGVADRGATFDLMEATLAGRPADMLALTERAHERGADMGLVLQDLLDLVHTLTRLKSIPALRDSRDLPEAERTRGAAMADAASVPTLARAWQILLKGLSEVEQAPDRRAAAEMVLIRLCYAADLPSPADLIRKLTADPSRDPPSPTPKRVASGGGEGGFGAAPFVAPGAHVPVAPVSTGPVSASSVSVGPVPVGPVSLGPVAKGPVSMGPVSVGPVSVGPVSAGAALAMPSRAPLTEPAAAEVVRPHLASFRDVAALVAACREPMLHAHLVHSVHLVRFAPGVIELRPEPDAPRDLASRLAALLLAQTGTRWTIAVTTAPGEPTLADQGNEADARRRALATDHPMVQAILAAFPGARIEAVRDARADAYGLVPLEAVTPEPPPDLEFAPDDAEPADDMPEPFDDQPTFIAENRS